MAAIMPHIPSYGGEEGREGGVWNCARKPASIEAVTLVRRKIATFLRVFRTIKLVFYRGVAQLLARVVWDHQVAR